MQFAQKLVKERRLNGKLKCGLGKVGPGKQEEDARACKWTKVQVEEIDSRKKEKLLDDRKPGSYRGRCQAQIWVWGTVENGQQQTPYVTKDEPMKDPYEIDSVLLQGQEHVRWRLMFWSHLVWG